MVWKVVYIIPGDTSPVEEHFETEEKADNFANRAQQVGWYVITIEEEGRP